MPMLTTTSGFPEWLPEDQLVAQHLTDIIRAKFELHGFTPLETRAIEPLDQLLQKGETDKEIYVLRRLQADADEPDKDIGLHFDLTVPFARYVSENRGKLVFPLRRYQIQKAWRGERPGLGRFREFAQADIDIVSDRDLTVQSDAEIVVALVDILLSLPIPPVHLTVNNRKVLEGFYRAFDIEAAQPILRIVDKFAKIGKEGVRSQLVAEAGLSAEIAEKCLRVAEIRTDDPDHLLGQIQAIEASHALLEEGAAELAYLLRSLKDFPAGLVTADLSVARGLDYYTGSVFEARFADLPKYPSIAGGGRYDNLVSGGQAGRLPGVGVSIGISRILGVVLHEGLLRATRKTPSCVLVALISDELRQNSAAIAQALRRRGIPCEVYERSDRYSKQIRYADKLGIPFVWFPGEEASDHGEVKDIRSGVQVPAEANTWQPPEVDRLVRFIQDESAYEELLQNPAYR